MIHRNVKHDLSGMELVDDCNFVLLFSQAQQLCRMKSRTRFSSFYLALCVKKTSFLNRSAIEVVVCSMFWATIKQEMVGVLKFTIRWKFKSFDFLMSVEVVCLRVTLSTVKVVNDCTRLTLRKWVESQVLKLKLYCSFDFAMKIFLAQKRGDHEILQLN